MLKVPKAEETSAKFVGMQTLKAEERVIRYGLMGEQCSGTDAASMFLV